MIAVGSRVYFAHFDYPEDIETGFFPPIGTHGTVVFVKEDDETCVVKWDSGTKGDGAWWCDMHNIEEVKTIKEELK
jgi:hypothetical protein